MKQLKQYLDLSKLHKIQEYFGEHALLHFGYSYIICTVLYMMTELSLSLCCLVTFIIGLGKELFVDNSFGRDNVVEDILGIIFACAILLGSGFANW